MAALLLVFFLGAPVLAIGAAHAAARAAAHTQRQERSWRQVSAVLQESAAAGEVAAGGDGSVAWVQTRWTAPGGGEKTGAVAVSLDARAGQRVAVWITPSGQVTHPPLSAADLRDRAALAVVVTVLGLAAVLGTIAGFVRLASNRRRMTCWTTDWAAAAARWASPR